MATAKNVYHVAVPADQLDAALPQEPGAWNSSSLALTGAPLAAGLWSVRGGKQRQEDEETEARRLWFAHQGQQKDDQSYPEQDGDDPWPETLAGDESDDTRWQEGIDRLCEALFHGKDEPDLLVPTGDVAPQRSLAPRRPIGGIAAEQIAQPPKRKFDAPRRSKPVKAPDEPRGGGPGRWLWLAACLVIGLSCLWKGLPQNPTPAASQTAPARLVGSEPSQRYVTANIEDLRVGDWVLAHNPELSDAERAEFAQVDPPTWRELTLRMTKADGSRLDIQLLRPLWWIEEYGAAPGQTIHLDLAELGAEGPAEVLAVAPCPPIGDPPTAGCRVVTGTFAHSSGETLDLHIDGLCVPIGVTANHPIWSEDRQAFVPAGELQVGERLRKADGTLTQVLLLADGPGVEPVFNREVEVEHVYFVTPEGILVHNRYGTGKAPRRMNGQFWTKPGPRGEHYLNRPKVRADVRRQVEARADRAPDGRFLDANTRTPIEGKYDLGHVPRAKFSRMREIAERKGWTQKEFNDYMNNPDFYQIEAPRINRSHLYE